MIPEPQPTEFDPTEELALFAEPEHQLYGLPQRTYFYLVVTARAIESFAESAFVIQGVLDTKTKALAGCCVDFVVKSHAFRIDVHERLRLFASAADEADSHRWMTFEADSANPTAWEGLLKAIGRVEHFGVFMNHADRLRLMYSQWLVERQRRDDDRGF